MTGAPGEVGRVYASASLPVRRLSVPSYSCPWSQEAIRSRKYDDDVERQTSRMTTSVGTGSKEVVAVKTEGTTVAGRPLPPHLARSGIGAPV